MVAVTAVLSNISLDWLALCGVVALMVLGSRRGWLLFYLIVAVL